MKENYSECVCDGCGLYWPSKAAIQRHEKVHTQDLINDTLDPEDNEIRNEFENEQEELSPMPVFEMKQHLRSPFQLTDNTSDSESE